MHHARLGVILAGLAAFGLAAWAEGCLFAPDDCGDLLKCSGAGGAGGAGGAHGPGSTASSAAATTGSGLCSSTEGCSPCVSDVDCGPPTNDGCTVSTCVASMCTPKDTAGTLAATQTANDCKKNVCGDGKPVSQDDPLDLPADDGNACTDQTCVGGVPTFVTVAPDTACANGFCDDKGVCINCTKDFDCKVGTTPTCDLTVNTCISCSDGIQNGTETGLDCGGICKTCDGDPCAKPIDCKSGQCADGVCCDAACSGACQACNLAGSIGLCSSVPIGQPDLASCPLGSQTCNGVGMCKRAAGAACANDGECASNACLAGLCRTQSGGDCATSLTCASGRCFKGKCADCAAASDCASMACSAPTCKAPGGTACDVDGECAGGKCQLGLCLVDNGSKCSANADCLSGVCTAGACGPCSVVNPCSAGAACGMTAFGPSGTCDRPAGAYCKDKNQCQSISPCTGFPPTCQ